jgi:N-acetylglucosamine malate deacetylase 1
MLNKKGTVLILAPHTDDGEWGLGGTAAKLVEDGHDVYYAGFSTCKESLPNGLEADTLAKECQAACDSLGIKKLFLFDYKVRYFNYHRQEILEDMVKLNKQLKPNVVFFPCSTDIHQDHNTIYQEAIRAFKGTNLLGYELIWNTIKMSTTFFSVLDERHVAAKAKAIACYKSQEFRSYHTKEFIESLSKTRGVQIGKDYAEAFELVRWIF